MATRTRTMQASLGMSPTTPHGQLPHRPNRLSATTLPSAWTNIQFPHHEHSLEGDGSSIFEPAILCSKSASGMDSNEREHASNTACTPTIPLSGVDSFYVSHSSTDSTARHRNSFEIPGTQVTPQSSWLQRRRATKLKPFSKPIPTSTTHRYLDLMILFKPPLYKYIQKDRVSGSIVSVKLKMLGEEESVAKPWIVAFCDKELSKRVKKFFRQD